MELSLKIHKDWGMEQVMLTIKNGAENVVEKLIAAVQDGRLPVGPYLYDWEVDDYGAQWMNTQLRIDGVWHGIGANASSGEVYIVRGLDSDGLDYTAPEIRDLNHYWMGFLSPLKKVLAIIQ